MKKHYSIDLETLGTRYDSYILSIGVAEFDIDTGEVLGDFHLKTVCNNDYHIDINTVMWWLNQSEEARKGISDKEHAVDIAIALGRLNFFISDHKNAVVWGNGSSFDITLLDHAYSKCGLKQPWQFWNVRDMRTILDIATVKGFDKSEVKRKGTHHSALDDAIYQAEVISAAWNYAKYRSQGL